MSVYQDAVSALSVLSDLPTLDMQVTRAMKKKAPKPKQSTSGKNSIQRLIKSEDNAYEHAAKRFQSLIDQTHGEVVVTFRVD